MNYPYDIVVCKRKNAALSVEGHFTYYDEESPLKIFHPKFSMYKFAIISGEGTACFTIHMDDVPGIEKRTDVASDVHFRPKAAASDVPASPAYTLKFGQGNMKGKTPVDILVEYPGQEGKDMLNKQYTWLKQNLEKYPRNKAMLDAIIEASKLDPRDLAKQSVKQSEVFNLVTVNGKPLVRKKRDDGLCFCYEGNITWDTARDYPVCVTIKNYYAPVVENEDKTLNIRFSEKDKNSEIVKTFNLTADEWLNIVSELKASKEAFRICNFNKAYKAAEEAGKANREAAATSRQAS